MIDHTEAFATIWGKATGGRTVAVDPHLVDAAEGFTVDPAPGVREVCEWLKSAVEGSGPLRMVFLVGGPGGGKSHAVNRVTSGLQEEDADDTGLAQRRYRYFAGESRLIVVNDASIRSGTDRHALADDIDRAAGNGDYFMSCVNRGILVEEAHALVADSPGAAVVRWLAGVQPNPGSDLLEVIEQTMVLERANLSVGPRTFEIAVVNVDSCSLFEVRPLVDLELKAAAYKVKRMNDRPDLDLQTLPAGALLNRVVENLSSASYSGDAGVDPVRANIESLSADVVRGGLLTILRSAEAVAGARMSFREVWGAVLRCLVGDLPRDSEAAELSGMFPVLDPTMDPLETFEELRRRSRIRFSEALFGAGLSQDERLGDPLLRFTVAIDPILDAAPGRLQDQSDLGWASPVLDAFSGLITSASPLKTLSDSLPEGDGFKRAVTPFDRNLDHAFVAVTQPEGIDDRKRRDVIAWYGDYLSRLYAVSNGVSAFRPEVSMWFETRSTLPSLLEQQLKTLLRPARDPDDPYSEYLLPLFSSRTIPLTGSASEPQLALKGEAVVELRRLPRGDAVAIQMLESGAVVGEIELDFALLRSALACASHRLGLTEQASRVGPRVERFRAKRLVPARVAQSDFRLVSGPDVSDVYVED